MPIQEKELKGILKSLKAINAALGAAAGTDLLADAQALNTDIDLTAALVGTGTAGLSFTDQTTLLEAQLE